MPTPAIFPVDARKVPPAVDAPASLDELLRQLADGRREAFAPAFRLLWPPTLTLCQRLCASEADAQDAAQAAMIRILERANDYDPARPALPWALALASWECRTLAKRRERRRETGEQPAVSDGGAAAEDAEQRQLVEAAMTAMGTLSPADRETLVATYWDAVASVSGATLRKRRERALTRLRSAFRRLYGVE